MFKSKVLEAQPVVAYLEAKNVEILAEDFQPGAVVFSLKVPSGEHHKLTVDCEFLQYTTDQIENYLKSQDFLRKLEARNQHIDKRRLSL
jgi:hypothetical protein